MKLPQGGPSRKPRSTEAEARWPKRNERAPKRKSKAAAPAKRPSGRTARNQTNLGKSPPDFIPFALCQLVDIPPDGPDWVHEIKLDGWRLQVRVEDGRATLRTRKGLDYTGTFPELAKAARGFDNCMIDGEICFVRKDGITDFSELQASMKAGKTDRLVFFAFDLLWLDGKDLRSKSLVVRKKMLLDLLSDNTDQKIIRLAEHLDAAGRDVLRVACNLKLEGIVSKRLSEPYVSGRTGIWTKAKCRATQHALIGGWTYSDKGFSGLLLGVRKGKKLIPIGRAGTGFPQKLLRWLEPRLKELEIKESPFSGSIPRKANRELHWARPELVAGFEMTSWTNDGVIRQASLQDVRERTDGSFRPDWINPPGD